MHIQCFTMKNTLKSSHSIESIDEEMSRVGEKYLASLKNTNRIPNVNGIYVNTNISESIESNLTVFFSLYITMIRQECPNLFSN